MISRLPLDEARGRIEQAETLLRWLSRRRGRYDLLGWCFWADRSAAVFCDQATYFRRTRFQNGDLLRVSALLGPGSEDLDPRPKGRRTTGFPSSPENHTNVLGARVQRGLIGEPRFANSRLAGEDEKAPLTGLQILDPRPK